MNKVKIELGKLKNIVVRNGKTKIEVKPFITTKELIAITNVCVRKFESDTVDSFATIKTLFDMMVVELCTSVKVDGVNISSNANKTIIDIQLNENGIEKFEGCGLVELIAPNISNYNECYKTVVKTIEMANVKSIIGEIVNVIPNADSLSDGLENLKDTIDTLKVDNPEVFSKLSEIAIKDTIKGEASKQVKKGKSTAKKTVSKDKSDTKKNK